jgi:hypothetical protein
MTHGKGTMLNPKFVLQILRITIHNGCPRQMTYLLNGSVVHPDNTAVNPKKTELVTFTAP